ncbi:tetratricopeptide repeat protein [Pseudoruegeria sp. HB172150]|uniref:tetratricopeptide repeat protein n=1 Tax=Pseudoruegeria sp. HB172150 TaxID=2721164 RepID=UPI001554E99F
MSDSDNFIDEVTEAVRRDQLFGYFRRYGWIALAVVLLIVGGAAYNEWTKAQRRAAAEARGDAILTALDAGDPAARMEALEAVDAEGGARAVTGMLEAQQALEAGDDDAAVVALRAVEEDAEMPALYRQMATLKRVILTSDSTTPADRIAELEPLATPGAPFRVLAEEQIALAELESGDVAGALDRLRALSEDTEASAGLRQRASQLIMALGGAADAA